MEICLNIIGRGRRRSGFKEWRFLTSLTILFFLCFCATYISPQSPEILSDGMRILPIEADDISYSYKSLRSLKIGANTSMGPIIGGARRLLGGLGSSPPRCTSKCGGCTPCKPVHVPVPPGAPVTTEYYPEAWRCKCRNKFYIP